MTEMIETAESTVRLAERLGADEAEVFITTELATTVSFEKVLRATRTTDGVGAAIRVAVGKRIGFTCFTSVAKDELERGVSRAIAVAKAVPETQDWRGFAQNSGKAVSFESFDPKLVVMQPSKMVQMATSAMQQVESFGKGAYVARGNVAVEVDRLAVANSNGVAGSSKNTAISFAINVAAEGDGKKGSSWRFDSQPALGRADFEGTTRRAAEEAVVMIKATSPPSGTTRVIFGDTVTSQIMDVMLGGTLLGEAVQEGRSPWAEKVGKKMAQENFTLTDDGAMMWGLATRRFDSEGVPQRTTPLISKGVLDGFLYDVYTAKKEGRESTGNARRSGGVVPKSFARPPKASTTNLVLAPGDASLAEMIEEARDGIYVTSTIGEWLSNPIRGQLDATISGGYLVKNGRLDRPIKGASMHADFFKMINGGIELIGKDSRNTGSTYSPPILVRDVQVSGTV